MKKRAIIISDSEEENNPPPAKKRAAAPRTKKKASVPSSQPPSKQKKQKVQFEPSTQHGLHDDDIIDDDFDDLPPTQSTVSGSRSQPPSTSQRQLKVPWTQPISSKQASVTPDVAADDRIWSEKYAPTASDTIAVHKKKVQEVRSWLEGILSGRTRKRLLILTGPAGAGKTATVEVLAKEIGFETLEWRNPTNDGGVKDEIDYDSLSRKFSDFINRGDRYSSLEFAPSARPGSAVVTPPTSTPPDTTLSVDRPKVVLIEDIPNTFTTATNSKKAFQEAISSYLLSPRQKYPMILIITETEPRGTEDTWGSRNDVMSARTLLTRDILENPYVDVITFNPVAKTYILKALKNVLDKEGRRVALEIVEAVAESAAGDIRSALNSLQFLATHNSLNIPSIAGLKGAKRKRGEKSGLDALTADQRRLIDTITSREAALGVFHAIGKVVYNKRIGDDAGDPPCPPREEWPGYPLPKHLLQYERRPSHVNPELLLQETSIESSMLLWAVHQNFTESCTDPDQLSDILDALSTADYLMPQAFQRKEAFTQETMAAMYGIGGVLMGLPTPVRRANASYRLNYPPVAKIRKEENQVRMFLEDLGGDYNEVVLGEGRGTAGWASKDMMLDILPMQAKILRNCCPQNLRKLTSLGGGTWGMAIEANTVMLEEDIAPLSPEAPGPNEKVEIERGGGRGAKIDRELARRLEEEMVLEDDDIED
ncbi:RFC checkpoint protein Rad17 [Saitoella coloradoensis]